MDAHKGVEVERVHMAVPAGESSWLLHGFWTGRAALLCRGLRGNAASMAMGESQGCHGGQLSCCVPPGPRGHGRRGSPIASLQLGVGNSSMKDALFPLNERRSGPGVEEGLLSCSR